jgi:hypothetical protein
MSKYVMVDTVSQFRMRYVVEVPDDVENPTWIRDDVENPIGRYPCTPEAYASDSVTCEDVREFSQEHIGETIVSTREVSLEEAIAQWRKDNGGAFDVWSDELVVKNSITEIGFNREEYYETEEEKWVKKEEERLAEAVRRINDDNDYNEHDGGVESFR